MKKAFKFTLIILALIACTLLSVYYIFSTNIAVLEPKGLIGAKERELIITASLLMLIVVIPVYVLVWVFSLKYHHKKKARHDPDWEHNNIAECCWWGVPLVIIIILGVITWKSSHELNPFKPIESDRKPVRIQAVALQWKWLFIYPDYGIATVNHMQFPVETPLNFEITADAPMNSFWIPQLGGQIYAMPAMRSKLHLLAHETGDFRGLSSNLSGDGFAGMYFTASSTTNQEFEGWVRDVKRSKTLGWEEYLELVQPTSYVKPQYYKLGRKDLFDEIIMQYEPK